MNEFDPKAYWEHRLQESLDLKGTGYQQLGRAYNWWMYRLRRGMFLSTLRRIQAEPRNCRVLDVGAGVGFYVGLWESVGVERLMGIDIADVAVRYLRERYPKYEFARLDISAQLPSKMERQFDLISVFDVLFHIVDDRKFERAVANLSNLLAPGGLLLLSDNFLHDRKESLSHQSSRSLQDYETALDGVGLAVLRRRPMFFLMNAPVDTTSRVYSSIWKLAARVVSLHEAIGAVAGMLLYPLDWILVRTMRESPTTEIMVCQKIGRDGKTG